MKAAEFLELRKKETEKIIDIVKEEFLILDSDIIDAKPSEDKWSIAECFVHLNKTLAIYIPQMVERTKEKQKYIEQDKTFKLSWIGKMAVKSMTPKPDSSIPFKMKTFKTLKPNMSKSNSYEILNEFLGFQNMMLNVIEDLDGMSLTKPKIVTVIGPIIKMRIGDALHFMVAHNQRHITQAKNVLRIIS